MSAARASHQLFITLYTCYHNSSRTSCLLPYQQLHFTLVTVSAVKYHACYHINSHTSSLLPHQQWHVTLVTTTAITRHGCYHISSNICHACYSTLWFHVFVLGGNKVMVIRSEHWVRLIRLMYSDGHQIRPLSEANSLNVQYVRTLNPPIMVEKISTTGGKC